MLLRDGRYAGVLDPSLRGTDLRRTHSANSFSSMADALRQPLTAARPLPSASLMLPREVQISSWVPSLGWASIRAYRRHFERPGDVGVNPSKGPDGHHIKKEAPHGASGFLSGRLSPRRAGFVIVDEYAAQR